MPYLSKYVPPKGEAKEKQKKSLEYTSILLGYEELDAALIEKAYKKIGQNIKRLREEKGYTQLSLSEAIGHKSVSVISCAEICHRNYHFNIGHLIKIAGVLDVKMCEFFEGIDNMIKGVRDYKKVNEDNPSADDNV